jgi:hypothetical protein
MMLGAPIISQPGDKRRRTATADEDTTLSRDRVDRTFQRERGGRSKKLCAKFIRPATSNPDSSLESSAIRIFRKKIEVSVWSYVAKRESICRHKSGSRRRDNRGRRIVRAQRVWNPPGRSNASRAAVSASLDAISKADAAMPPA